MDIITSDSSLGFQKIELERLLLAMDVTNMDLTTLDLTTLDVTALDVSTLDVSTLAYLLFLNRRNIFQRMAGTYHNYH